MNQQLRAGLIVTADARELVGEMRESKEALAGVRREATVMGTDLTRAGGAADRFVSIFARARGTFRTFGAETKSAKDSASAFTTALQEEERGFRSLMLAIDPAARAAAEFKAGQDAVNRAVRLGITTNEEAARALQLLEARQEAATRSLQRGGGAVVGFGTAVQQGSYQLTDAVVQWQGGVDPMIIFAQQAPQFLGVFGALGASLGLVAALAPVAISMIFGAAEAGRDLDTVMGDLETSTKRVADSLKLIRDPNLGETFGNLTGDIRETTSVLLELDRAAQLKSLRETLDKLIGAQVDPGLGQSMWAGFKEGLQLRPMYLPSQVNAMQDALARENYAELTGGRGLGYNEFNSRRSQIDALAKAGETKRVLEEVGRLIQDMAAGGPITDMNGDLLEMLTTLGVVAEQTARVEAEFNRTAQAVQLWNSISASATTWWDGIVEKGARIRADAEERIRTAEQELALAQTIFQFGDQSAQADAERARIARENYELELERAGLYEADRDRLMEIYDATVAAQGATAIWADNMAAVGAEVSAILSMINSLAGGLIDRASKRAELEALKGGASVADAAAAGRKTRQEADWSAREQGSWVDRATVGVERWWSRGDDAIDAEIAAGREAARTRDRKSAGGGGGRGGGISAAASITAEIARLRPSYEADIAAAEAWRDKALASLNKAGAGYAEFADEVQSIFDEKVAEAYRADLERRDDWQAGVERAFLKLTDDAMTWADVSESIITKFGQSGEEAFVKLAKTGKLSFGGLADFIIEQLARLAYQQMILPGLNAMFGSIFPGLAPAASAAAIPTNHTGSPGVMRSYALGPAYGDTMRSDERLTMMRKGEEIMTSRALENAGALISAMTALAARPVQGSSAGGINVQLVNNGTPQKVERTEETTDSRGQRQYLMITSDIVADGLAAPGGAAGRAAEGLYGLRRAPRRRGG